MCIAPRIMKNPKYTKTKKNKGVIPHAEDERLKWIEIGCGQCEECRKKKATDWKVRLLEEIKQKREGQFVTLTISQEWGEALEKEANTKDSETIAGLAIKRFRERWRKKYKKSPRHFLITELGHKNQYRDSYGQMRTGTERLHIHGIIFENISTFGEIKPRNIYNKKEGNISKELTKLWKYGYTLTGYSEVNEKMIGYVIKYITKIDMEHEGFYGKIFTSPGIGKKYTESKFIKFKHKYRAEKTNKKYKTDNGTEIALPQYWKKKLWSDKQREKLRIFEEDKGVTWIAGTKIKTEDYAEIMKARAYQIKRHHQLKLWGEKKTKYEWIHGVKIKQQENNAMEKQKIQMFMRETKDTGFT